MAHLHPDAGRHDRGFEAAWKFFGGIFAVVIPDNMAAIVDKANPTEPRLNPPLSSTRSTGAS